MIARVLENLHANQSEKQHEKAKQKRGIPYLFSGTSRERKKSRIKMKIFLSAIHFKICFVRAEGDLNFANRKISRTVNARGARTSDRASFEK